MIFYNHSSLVILVKDAKYIHFYLTFHLLSAPSYWPPHRKYKPFIKSIGFYFFHYKCWLNIIDLSYTLNKYIHSVKLSEVGWLLQYTAAALYRLDRNETLLEIFAYLSFVTDLNWISKFMYCKVTLPYPKFTFDHSHYLIVLPFSLLAGCTLHFVLLRRHLKTLVFYSSTIFNSYNFHSHTFSHSYNFFHSYTFHPLDTGRKLNIKKTFKRRPGRLLNVLCTLNLRPVTRGHSYTFLHLRNFNSYTYHSYIFQSHTFFHSYTFHLHTSFHLYTFNSYTFIRIFLIRTLFSRIPTE